MHAQNPVCLMVMSSRPAMPPEGLFHNVSAWLYVVEDFLPENEIASINPCIRCTRIADTRHLRVLIGFDKVECLGRRYGNEARRLS